jgi:hypothetical protein
MSVAPNSRANLRNDALGLEWNRALRARRKTRDELIEQFLVFLALRAAPLKCDEAAETERGHVVSLDLFPDQKARKHQIQRRSTPDGGRNSLDRCYAPTGLPFAPLLRRLRSPLDSRRRDASTDVALRVEEQQL